MHCIFCKSSSVNSKSVEHIIPESLGNKQHVLPKGIVCDGCNNYFSTKLEKPVLEKPYFQNIRHRHDIENKRGRIPIQQAIIGRDPAVYVDRNRGDFSIIIDNPLTIQGVMDGTIKHLLIPHIDQPEPNDKDVSRFLGKMAIEALTQRCLTMDGWLDEITHKEELEKLKNYVRFGTGVRFWEYSQRRIYGEDAYFFNPSIQDLPYQLLHEFTLLYTPSGELYFVIAIMGIEYGLNFTDPKNGGYASWLIQNKQQSPLDIDDSRIIVQYSDDETFLKTQNTM